ncbi:hypothetical protein Tdes44962_MAKER09013 [Teratosphaeria destructans]|uniref:Uncharacterized protein n=1 Tax=Teratosphaeria destructans TaxID=418781 RepID=A0A9W7SUS6_9PEZI|nr:hypothetical protein Tdes44962_MAKER09013 [Teratosphaeria destructans]
MNSLTVLVALSSLITGTIAADCKDMGPAYKGMYYCYESTGKPWVWTCNATPQDPDDSEGPPGNDCFYFAGSQTEKHYCCKLDGSGKP